LEATVRLEFKPSQNNMEDNAGGFPHKSGSSVPQNGISARETHFSHLVIIRTEGGEMLQPDGLPHNKV